MVLTNLPCLWDRVKQADLTQGRLDQDSVKYSNVALWGQIAEVLLTVCLCSVGPEN